VLPPLPSPSSQGGAPHLYFRCIAEYTSPESYRAGLAEALQHDGLFNELSQELWARSRAAKIKYRWVGWGLSFLAITLGLGAGLGLAVIAN
jgi:hypothetical protein